MEVILQRLEYNFQYTHINSCHSAICVPRVTVDVFIYRYISLNLCTFSFSLPFETKLTNNLKTKPGCVEEDSQGDLGATR